MALSLLLIVVNLSVIQILNAQVDSSNERKKLDEQSRIVFIDPIDYSNEPRDFSPKIMFPIIPPRTGCGLRNVVGIGMGSTTSSVSTAVCMHLFYLCIILLCVIDQSFSFATTGK